MSLSGQEKIQALKALANTPAPPLVICVEAYAGYRLRPVATQPGHLNRSDVKCLTDWRNRYVKSFLTEFVATESRTAHWLENTVHGDDGKVLFMLDAPDGQTVGYMGLAYIDWSRRYGEADAIVRGLPGPKGLMSAALLTLLNWAQKQLGLLTLGVRVLSDNSALSFYQHLGFKPVKQIPLTPRQSESDISWEETPTATSCQRHLVYHVLEQS